MEGTKKSMKPIRVVDSIMGSGKSTAAIQMMNQNDDKRYIYITPFLNEIDRIKRECSSKIFYSPENYDKDGNFRYKMDSFITLLSEGKNIASTHALFKEISIEVIELIKSGGYILILDEVMDVVSDFPVKERDQKMFMDNQFWYKDEHDFMQWNIDNTDANEYDGRFNDLKQMSLNKSLKQYSNNTMIWSFPYQIFQAFDECYVLTYLFDGQIQKYYFDLHHIPYEKYTVEFTGFGDYFRQFIKGNNHEKEIMIRHNLKQKIHIYEGNLNNIGENDKNRLTDLSKSWYNNKKKKELHKLLKNNMNNYFKNIVKASASDRIWTTFKDFQDDIGEKRRYGASFLSCNIRATNEYRDRKHVAYLINRYMRPVITNYFSQYDVKVDQNLWAVSELIQFIWRSAIREDNDIHVYIPSKRMRMLFIQWLNGEDIMVDTNIPVGLSDDSE
ncbi:hypothetical protein PQ460_07900 [Paenibacillus sp. KACC 21273]|uniref:hypothetical protein n=1 Tax=Paenibacillus sp. KACC 21273 TaxID=3025665 RepID=UPI0023650767|nr:hypothetical protein [Paenibacillus sp. KACC 21273]WDF52320.1 hypothetical protein PQ460_07900 [Paenibacillus sp. KACC 21273]